MARQRKTRNKKNQSVKHDQGKPRLSLISPIASFKTGRVMTNGEATYGTHNWRVTGFKWTRLADAIKRHLEMWIAGMDNDPDHPDQSNLDCAAAGIMMLQEFTETHRELDDRYKLPMEILVKMYPAKEKNAKRR